MRLSLLIDDERDCRDRSKPKKIHLRIRCGGITFYTALTRKGKTLMDLALNAAGPGSEIAIEAVIVDGSPARNVIGPLNGKLTITGGDETVATVVEGDAVGHYTVKAVSGKITTDPVKFALASVDHPELTGELNVTVPMPGPPAGVDVRPVVSV